MLEIRLSRVGKTNQPHFRLVVTEHTKPAKTGYIEILGAYHPAAKIKMQAIKIDRVKFWLKQGAHLSQTAASILKPYLKEK